MYDKVSYNLKQLTKIYGEDVYLPRSYGRMILQRPRLFFEYENPETLQFKKNGSYNKHSFEVSLNFPHSLPLREPKENWMQVATEMQGNPDLYKLLGEECPLDITGLIPGSLVNRKRWIDVPSEFYVEEHPEHSPINYVLFLVHSSNYLMFIEDVRYFMQIMSNIGRQEVCDSFGCRIFISDSATEFMVLVPAMLLNGGKEAVAKIWKSIF